MDLAACLAQTSLLGNPDQVTARARRKAPAALGDATAGRSYRNHLLRHSSENGLARAFGRANAPAPVASVGNAQARWEEQVETCACGQVDGAVARAACEGIGDDWARVAGVAGAAMPPARAGVQAVALVGSASLTGGTQPAENKADSSSEERLHFVLPCGGLPPTWIGQLCLRRQVRHAASLQGTTGSARIILYKSKKSRHTMEYWDRKGEKGTQGVLRNCHSEMEARGICFSGLRNRAQRRISRGACPERSRRARNDVSRRWSAFLTPPVPFSTAASLPETFGTDPQAV